MTDTKKQNDKKAIEPALFKWIRKQYKLRPSHSFLNLFKQLLGLQPKPKKSTGWDQYNEFMYDHAIDQLASGAPSPLLYAAGDDPDQNKHKLILQPKETIFQKQLTLLEKYNFRFTSSSISITRILDKITKLHRSFNQMNKQGTQLKNTPQVDFQDYALKYLTNKPMWLTINPDDQAIIMKICQNDVLMKQLCTISPKPLFPNFQINNLLPKPFMAKQLLTHLNPWVKLKPKLKPKKNMAAPKPSAAVNMGS